MALPVWQVGHELWRYVESGIRVRASDDYGFYKLDGAAQLLLRIISPIDLHMV